MKAMKAKAMKGKAMKAKPMKAMKAKAMKARKAGAVLTKSGVFDAVSEQTGLKRKDVSDVVAALAEVAAAALKKSGQLNLPGLARLKLKHKAARPATTKMMFGEMKKVGAKPASKVVKAFPAKSLKDSCSK
jgi:nucleoid DNA-binding protein